MRQMMKNKRWNEKLKTKSPFFSDATYRYFKYSPVLWDCSMARTGCDQQRNMHKLASHRSMKETLRKSMVESSSRQISERGIHSQLQAREVVVTGKVLWTVGESFPRKATKVFPSDSARSTTREDEQTPCRDSRESKCKWFQTRY